MPTNLAANACATSPILTTSAAATRAATVATLALPAGATSTSGYALLGIGTPEAPTGYPVNQFVSEIDDGTANNRLFLYKTAAVSGYSIEEEISGVQTSIAPSGAWAQNTQQKITGFAATNLLKGVVSNGTIVSGAPTGLAAGLSTMRIGTQQTGASQFNGTIARLVVAPASLLAN